MDEDGDVLKVYAFDGQIVWYNVDTELFEVGNFLGGGAAGTVYECEHVRTKERFALKILNPLGYKILAPALLRRCNVICKGNILLDNDRTIESLCRDHVWWLINATNKQYIAAYFSEKFNALRELSLIQCIEIWGSNPTLLSDDENDDGPFETVQSCDGPRQVVPIIPPKFIEFIRRRRRIFREIKNMRKIVHHHNVIHLNGVLELTQESKCTIFLVMELANGGELFDRIKIDCGTREDTAKFFFQQLLNGVKHCHDQGVCHRDLKPENLLLQDNPGSSGSILKIADFGFSARFAMNENTNNHSSDGNSDDTALRAAWSPELNNVSAIRQRQQQVVYTSLTPSSSLMEESPLRVLTSVVGSPFYVAPEVMSARGYDGPKADVWSLGVILYAMLAGNLPFGQELSTCKRFRHFCKWVREQSARGVKSFDDPSLEYPQWLFPPKFTTQAKGLIVSMLHPDPACRLSVSEAMKHSLCYPKESETNQMLQFQRTSSTANTASFISPMLPVRREQSYSSINSNVSADINVKGKLFANEHEPNHLFHENKIGESNERNSPLPNTAINTIDVKEHHIQEDYSEEMEMMVEGFEEAEDEEMFKMEGDNSDNEDKVYSSINTIEDSQGNYTTLKGSNLFPEDLSSFKSISSSFQHPQPYTSAASSYARGTPPPLPVVPPHIAPTLPAMADLITDDDEHSSPLSSGSMRGNSASNARKYTLNSDGTILPLPVNNVNSNYGSGNASVDSRTNSNPPSFIDSVKRSTRFITAVPAVEVLTKVEGILNSVRVDHIETPIGFIGKVELNWDQYRLEVWGQDINTPALCALQLYQMSPTSLSPDRNVSGSYGASSLSSSYRMSDHLAGLNPNPSPLYLAEFVRAQLEIFAFKRFYQWVRHKLSELVKRDYSVNLFDQAISPRMDSYLMQQYQQHHS